MVITASNENILRIHDSKNGTLLAQRQLYPPFLQSDIGCADVTPYIGIMGTPYVDVQTDIMYVGGRRSPCWAWALTDDVTSQVPFRKRI
jgi:iron transport multicopper oxidase